MQGIFALCNEYVCFHNKGAGQHANRTRWQQKNAHHRACITSLVRVKVKLRVTRQQCWAAYEHHTFKCTMRKKKRQQVLAKYLSKLLSCRGQGWLIQCTSSCLTVHSVLQHHAVLPAQHPASSSPVCGHSSNGSCVEVG